MAEAQGWVQDIVLWAVLVTLALAVIISLSEEDDE